MSQSEDRSTSATSLAEKDDAGSTSCTRVVSSTLPGGGYSTIPLWRTFIMMTGLTMQLVCKTSAVQSMNVAVGFISQSLDFTTQETSWIQSSYALASGCLLMLFIPLSAQFGARSVFLCSCLLFMGGQWRSIGCSAAHLQGLGASGTVPAGFQIVHQVFPRSTARDMAFAVFSVGLALGSVLGTIFGGFPAQYSAIRWRGIYVVLACLSAASSLCVLISAPPSVTKPVAGGIDYLGGGLISVALTSTLFSISQGSNIGWRTPYVIVLLVVGIIFFPVFAAWEIHLENKGCTPMICMSNFKRGRYTLISLLSLLGFGSFIIWTTSRFGLLGAPLAVFALRKLSTQIVFIVGCILLLSSNIIFAVASPKDTYWNRAQFLGPTFATIGAGWVYTSGVLYLISCVPPEQATASGSWYAVLISYASSLGIIVAFAVIDDYPTSEPNVWTNGYWTGAAWAAFAAITAVPAFWDIGTLGRSGETFKARRKAERDNEAKHTTM
ncbi:MFS general substrate transporter [Hymenopellis radicata]|nr:MFS general substrate transporter [Hymenopellis radicata]